jgi:RimJ/RimL family protein N-acetyltransferase
MDRVTLRAVIEADLPAFHTNESDPQAAQMAAFTSPNRGALAAFLDFWHTKVLTDPSNVTRTVLVDDRLAGYVVKFEMFGKPSVAYWLGREFWGRGVATHALRNFLTEIPERPLHARVAADNHASIRVLEKCGFSVVGRERAFANARNAEVDELLFELRA